MADQTTKNDALAKAVHDLVNARPDSVRGRIVFAVDDINDEKIRRTTEASGKMDAEFLGHFIAAATEYFANVLTENGMPPHIAAIGLMSAAKAGIDSALGDDDDTHDEA